MGITDQRRILDNLTTAVLLLDEALRVRYINPAGEELFQNSARRMTGFALNRFLASDGGCIANLNNALATGHPYTEREKHLILNAGQEITVACIVTPLAEPDRSRSLLVEMQPLDRQLRISHEEQLLNQQKATRAMVRGVAHELKNPLGGLRGAAQLLERELNEDLKEYTRIIIGEADRLHALVDRMLGPNGRPDKRMLDVHEVVEHVRQLVAAEAPAEVRIVRDYDPSIPPVHADRDLLIQACLNIVRNALQALSARSDGGGGEILLRTRIQRQITIGQTLYKLAARIDVIDDGPGISPDMIEQIFYPMVTGRERGAGLGLSIAQSLVNAHGGLIECQSMPGLTCFSVLLPIPADTNG